MMIVTHPLDNAIWNALTTRHSHLAEGDGYARRYDPAVAPFGATSDGFDASYRALLDQLAPGQAVSLFTTEEVPAPPGGTMARRDLVNQMILEGSPRSPGVPGAVTLAPADVPAMQALVAATRPGPFGTRTHETGTYIGVRDGDRLIAMTGERMRLDGFGEVSAVCVDPALRGKGLAAGLVADVARAMLGRGDTPFLHVFASNTPAIALYRKLGFVHRRTLHWAVMRHETVEA